MYANTQPETRSRSRTGVYNAATPPRKKPHCRTCGSPMAGHARQHGSPICPTPPPPPSSYRYKFAPTPDDDDDDDRKPWSVRSLSVPGMPGALDAEAHTAQSRVPAFCQLVLAGAVGGAVVVAGLAFL